MSAWTVIDHEEVPSGGVASIEFTSIAGTYTDLVLMISGRNEANQILTTISLNGVTTNRTIRKLTGNNNATASSTAEPESLAFLVPSSIVGPFSSCMIYFPNYAGNTAKSISMDVVTEHNGTAAWQMIAAGLWNSTAAITSIKIEAAGGDIAEYSSATLYGITKGSSGGVTVS